MTDATYSARPGAFASERVYTLEPDGLAWKDAKGEGRVAYADVVRAQISEVPDVLGMGQKRTILKPRSGRKLVLQDVHFLGVGRRERRTPAYRAFVLELLHRVAAANPSAHFVVGQSWTAWITWLVLLVGCVAVTLGGVVLLIVGEFPLQSIVVFGIVLLCIPAAWKTVRHGRPRRVDPGSLGQSLI